jgi:hypothetical protein
LCRKVRIDFNRLRLLVIDDNPHMRRIFLVVENQDRPDILKVIQSPALPSGE